MGQLHRLLGTGISRKFFKCHHRLDAHEIDRVALGQETTPGLALFGPVIHLGEVSADSDGQAVRAAVDDQAKKGAEIVLGGPLTRIVPMKGRTFLSSCSRKP